MFSSSLTRGGYGTKHAGCTEQSAAAGGFHRSLPPGDWRPSRPLSPKCPTCSLRPFEHSSAWGEPSLAGRCQAVIKGAWPGVQGRAGRRPLGGEHVAQLNRTLSNFPGVGLGPGGSLCLSLGWGSGWRPSPPMLRAGTPHQHFCPQCPRLVRGPFHSGMAHGGKSKRLPRVGLGSPPPTRITPSPPRPGTTCHPGEQGTEGRGPEPVLPAAPRKVVRP